MDKEELERELEKAEKGCVITVINQSSLPLSFDGSKHSHGKFKAKPPKSIPAKETASFSLEGRKSIDASVKFRWGKGRLELFWNMPEQGDPKIFYRVAPQLKNKLFVYIPSAVFGKVTKFIFLVDEKPATPISAQELSSPANPDTNDDVSSENVSDGESDMNRSASNGEINLTPKVLFNPNQLKSSTGSSLKLGDDDESKGSGFNRTSSDHSFGFSSDEEDEPKQKLKFVIRPASEEPRIDTLVPTISGIAPPANGPASTRRRSNTKTKENGIFGDLNDQFFQTGNTSVLSPTFSTPNPPTRERRLSMSDDTGGNKHSTQSRNSLPLDGMATLNFSSPQLSPPPHLTTPPLIPQSSPLPNSSHSYGALSPAFSTSSTPSPVGITRSSSKSSFELRMSFEDLRALTSSSGPLTPKPLPAPSQDISLAPRPSSVPTPLMPSSSLLKSPPLIASTPPSNGSVLIPHKAASFNNALSPSKQQLGNAPPQPSSFSFDSPARAMYAPMSPPLQRQPSIGRGLGNGLSMLDSDPKQAAVPRRYSEPPPVDLNLLFPEIAAAKDRNKKPDVIVTAQKYIQAAMAHLERNSIAAALGNLDLCISLLGTIQEETVQELEYCMRYRIFLVLLKEIAKPKPPIEHAFLAFFLTDIAVKPQHRVVAIRMAIRHNLNSQNFGIAAGLIQFLIERIHPVDENVLQDKLRKCMSQNRANGDQRFKKYTCPGCEATTSVSSMKCGLCQQPIKLCALTLEIINTKAYYSCKLCRLSFSRKSISPRDAELKCPFCKVGDLTNKIFVSSK